MFYRYLELMGLHSIRGLLELNPIFFLVNRAGTFLRYKQSGPACLAGNLLLIPSWCHFKY
eukprot:SAG11_NODE_189_length_13028_cov_14.222446_7_plen_60_part_00